MSDQQMQEKKLTIFLIKTYFWLKTLSKLEGSSVNLKKGIYEKLTINSTIYGKRLNIFPLRPGIRQVYPFSLHKLNILLDN